MPSKRKGRKGKKSSNATAAAGPVSSGPEGAIFAAVVAAPVTARGPEAVKFADAVKNGTVTVSAACAALKVGLGMTKEEQHAAIVCAQALVTSVPGSWASVASSGVLQETLTLCSHKKSKDIRGAADLLCATISDVKFSGMAAVAVLPQIAASNLGPKPKWQTKVAALGMIQLLAEGEEKLMSRAMPALVPIVTENMWSTKRQVKDAAVAAMTALCDTTGNPDIVPFIPILVETIMDPTQVTETVFKLASTTFVQTVTASALSLMVPLLSRAFREKAAVKRKAAVVTENLAKLVRDPRDVETFLPVLGPCLKKCVQEVPDEECRERCETAHGILMKLAEDIPKLRVQAAQVNKFFGTALKGAKAAPSAKLLELLGACGACFAEAGAYDNKMWAAQLRSVVALECFAGDEVAATTAVAVACAAASKKYNANADEGVMEEDEADKDLESLCDLSFSLAYGSNILLNQAHLKLRRGRRYGIIAGKSSGKTTLLRAIANYQIDGFPPASELRTIFVETDIKKNQMPMNVVEFVIDTIKHFRIMKDDAVRKVLTEMGFNKVMQDGPVKALSGGWKMKLALVRGMLMNTDIYLMDEPTNHLDVVNVQWVVDYLTGPLCAKVTSLIVSHDSKFLDKVCTHIVHFENLKLNTYAGNLSKFVEKKPEIKSYFDLSKSKLKFSFPIPKMIAGIKTRSRRLMSLEKVNFRYPGAAKNQLNDISIVASMASRVACVGANGAGKSTMIKVLTGELEPSSGKMWKHPEMRFAYVAQHAFHHIEQHMDKSPNEYIRWRYQSGEDKEALIKSTAIITEEEERIMEKKVEITTIDKDGNRKKQKWQIKKIVGRRKERKSYVYEVTFENQSMDENQFFSEEWLEKVGWGKKVKELNRRLVALEGLQNRPLTVKNVEEHCKCVGLEPEFATHNRLADLSGGQKVKVVLAACTWAQPHLIILDEPTNYLDRDSLGALASAIKEFGGGVLLITHNQEFADVTCKVTWVVANNRLIINGDAEWEKYAAEAEVLKEAEGDGEERDSHGNIIKKVFKAKPVEELTAKEIKKFKKSIRGKIKKNSQLEEWEEEYAVQWDLLAQ